MTTILSFPPAARRATRLALALMAGAALLCACTQEDAPGDGDARIPVTFSAALNSSVATSPETGEELGYSPATRTTNSGNTWLPTDRIGIIMARAGSDIDQDDESVLADNVAYAPADITTNAVGQSTATFARADAGAQPVVYPPTGNVDFYAYYPYTAKVTDGGTFDDNRYEFRVNLSDQSNPAAIDVLYAQINDVSRSSVPVQLRFRHQFAQITLHVTAGDSFIAADIAALTAAGVKIKINTDVTVRLWDDGKVKVKVEPATVNPHKENTAAGAAATFSVIVGPGNHDATPVTFALGGNIYTATLPAGQWRPGDNYVYPLTIRRTGIEVGTCSIEDWTVENKGTGTVEKPDLTNFAYIPAGTFLMGSPEGEENRNDDELQHEVTLTRGFYMAKYETTNAQYAAFLNAIGVGSDGKCPAVGSYPSGLHPGQVLVKDCTKEDAPSHRFPYGVTWDAAAGQWKPMDGYADHPVVYVTWYGADEYARRLGASLPTEAQWEYACRAGSTTAYVGGNSVSTTDDEDSGLDDYGWWEGNALGIPHSVGTKQPNAWGLYDMHGNAAEWCLDSWGGGYSADPAIDPVSPFPPVGYDDRVYHGGSYIRYATDCRSARRQSKIPGDGGLFNGFRIVFN